MHEEIVTELRNIVRACKFDFKLAAQQLVAFCALHGYDVQGINEISVREEYTKDFIATTTPVDHGASMEIPTSSTSTLQDPGSDGTLAPYPNQNTELQHEQSSLLTEMVVDEAKNGNEDKPFLTEIDRAIPSTAFSIIDLIERDGFDEFLAEIEAELDLRADSKTGRLCLFPHGYLIRCRGRGSLRTSRGDRLSRPGGVGMISH